MKFSIFLQHYFPYGGLQRDAMRLAQAAIQEGDQPTIIVSTWDGPKPTDIAVIELHSGGTSNHSKASRFSVDCQAILKSGDYDTSIGFSRIPGAPFHFCGDSCFLDKFRKSKPALARLLPRYQYFLNNEQLLFGPESDTHIFFLADPDIAVFQHHYQLPDLRITLLPPWLKKAESLDSPHAQIRERIFDELHLPHSQRLLLFVGSNFELKRVGKIIETLPLLPDDIHLAICGEDDPTAPRKVANSLGLSERVHIMGPRNDIPAWMVSADLLVHPSSRETAGMVLVEALTYGLPVTCTEVCGYASHVEDAGGTLLSHHCPPEELADTITTMLDDLPALRDKATAWAAKPSRYHTANQILDTLRSSII